ncbi:nitrile hydratase accessory protein [Rhodococcus koreensis]
MSTTPQGAAEIMDTRRRLTDLMLGMPGTRDGELAFEKPWELRAFAVAVAAFENQQFEWSEFQRALISSIKAWEERNAGVDTAPWSYYEHWLHALEEVLADNGLLNSAGLETRTREVLCNPPDRSHHEAHPMPIAVDPAV